MSVMDVLFGSIIDDLWVFVVFEWTVVPLREPSRMGIRFSPEVDGLRLHFW